MSFPYAPQVVAKSSFTDQTANIATTTVFTPTVDGDYLISCYVTMSTSATEGSIQATFSWTDEYGAVGSWSPSAGPDADPTGGVVAIAHVPSGNPITVKTEYFSGATSPYDVFVTVTQL